MRTRFRNSWLSRSPVLLLLVLFAVVRPADAANFNWASGVNGSINDPARWSPNGVPDSTSTLVYNAVGSYTVDLSASLPRLFQQNVLGGVVTFTNSQPTYLHTMYLTGGGAFFDGTTILGRTSDGTNILQDGGTLLFRNGVEFTGGGTVAYLNPASFDISRGSRLHLSQRLDVRPTGYLNVWSQGGSQNRFAGIDGGTLGITISGNSYVYDGGYVDIQGAIDITGGTTGSVQSMHVGPGNPAANSYVRTQSGLTVGRKLGLQSIPLFGKAELHVEDKAWVHAGGIVTIGDSLGDDGCLVRVNPGGTLIANGGLKVFSTNGPALEMRGGITHVRGGQFKWPLNKMLSVSSHLETAQLWLRNGMANIGPNYGSPFITGLMVGRGGDGLLRVTQSGTTLPVNGAVAVGDSLGGHGTVIVDSLGALTSTGLLSVGNAGLGQVQVRNGSSLTATNLLLGATADGIGILDARGTGTLVTLKDKVQVAGSDLGEGGYATLNIDQGAVVNVQQSGVNPSTVTIYANGGHLAIGPNARLQAGYVDVRDQLFLSQGTIQALSTTLQSAGKFNGYGTIGGHFNNLGSMDPSIDYGGFGRVAITGNFRQFASGHLAVQLGSQNGLHNDSLAVSGTVTLEGTLDLAPSATFVRNPGDVYTIITGSSITGVFSKVTWNGADITDQVQVLYTGNMVRVVIPSGSVGVEPSPGAAIHEIRFARVGGAQSIAFELTLPDAADVQVELFDAAGRRVATLAQGALPAGRHSLSAPGSQRLESGVYFARASVRTARQNYERVVKAVRLR